MKKHLVWQVTKKQQIRGWLFVAPYSLRNSCWLYCWLVFLFLIWDCWNADNSIPTLARHHTFPDPRNSEENELVQIDSITWQHHSTGSGFSKIPKQYVSLHRLSCQKGFSAELAGLFPDLSSQFSPKGIVGWLPPSHHTILLPRTLHSVQQSSVSRTLHQVVQGASRNKFYYCPLKRNRPATPVHGCPLPKRWVLCSHILLIKLIRLGDKLHVNAHLEPLANPLGGSKSTLPLFTLGLRAVFWSANQILGPEKNQFGGYFLRIFANISTLQ